jgi:WD40 repeat protein
MDGQAAAKVAGQVALVSSDNALPVSQQFANLLLLPQRQVENTDTTLSTALALASKPAHSGQKRKRAGSSASDGLSSLTLDPFRGLELLAATRDQVITRVTAGSLLPTKTIVGYNDDIVDIKYIPGPGQLLAVATNSEALRLTELTSWSTRLCAGHTDVILAVSAAPDGELVATASKDKTARVSLTFFEFCDTCFVRSNLSHALCRCGMWARVLVSPFVRATQKRSHVSPGLPKLQHLCTW